MLHITPAIGTFLDVHLESRRIGTPKVVPDDIGRSSTLRASVGQATHALH
jgi:hypothetical protein